MSMIGMQLFSSKHYGESYLRNGVADDAVDSASYYVVVALAVEAHCTHGSAILSLMIPWRVGLLMAQQRCSCPSPRLHRRHHLRLMIDH